MTNPAFGIIGLSGGELLLVLMAFLILGGLFAIGLATAAYFLLRSRKRPAPGPVSPPVQPKVPESDGERPPVQTNMAGTQFHDANLSGADFRNVNLSNARIHNADLSNVSITAAQIGGAVFKHVGPPPDAAGQQERQRPVRFEEMMLCDSTFRKVDLSNVRITDCDLTGMSIDGVLVTDLLAAYQRQPR